MCGIAGFVRRAPGEASEADRLLTRQLAQALNLLDVRLLDHFLVAGPHVESFAERGWM